MRSFVRPMMIPTSSVAHASSNEPMGIIELEGSLADAEKPKDLRPGSYVAEVQDVQEQTSQKGNVYYAVKFVIPQDELPNDLQDENPDGVILYWNRVLKPTDARSRYNLRVFMEALGLDTNISTVDPNDFMGCRARIRVRSAMWQGQSHAEIQSVEAAEKSSGKAKSVRRGQSEPESDDDESERTNKKKPAARSRR